MTDDDELEKIREKIRQLPEDYADRHVDTIVVLQPAGAEWVKLLEYQFGGLEGYILRKNWRKDRSVSELQVSSVLDPKMPVDLLTDVKEIIRESRFRGFWITYEGVSGHGPNSGQLLRWIQQFEM